jgi:peptidase M28-like protein/PA domain-containing protein
MTFRAAAGAAAAVSSLTFFFILWGWTNEIPLDSTGELTRHVRTLAADEMMGRGVETPGIERARDYIEAEFKHLGLAPGGDRGTYFQRLEVVTGVEVRAPTAANLDTTDLTLDRDWTPLGLSASGAVRANLVFAGYGITAKDYDYDDYAGLDARGKIVVVLRYEPPPKNSNSPFRNPPASSRYATLASKAANAREHGAAGLILADLSPKEGQKELIPTRRSLGRSEADLIVAQIRREIMERHLQAAGLSLSDLKRKIDEEEKPHSIAVASAAASLSVTLAKISRPTDNVVAILPGADPRLKQENIVIGAHYDHLGLGFYGALDPSAEGTVHNGADDNASGTAVMLVLAARLSRLPVAPPRTIVFVAFTGEELGLYGSRYFAAHPPFPITATKAMINLDMVGRMKDNKVIVFSVDSAKEFREMLRRATEGLDVEMRPGGGRTDHVSFYNQGIPSLHFYTGTHSDYHRPSDTWEKLNVEGMTKVADAVFTLANELAATKQALTFVKVPSGREG